MPNLARESNWHDALAHPRPTTAAQAEERLDVLRWVIFLTREAFERDGEWPKASAIARQLSARRG